MKYIPRQDFVVIEMDIPKERSRGGIFLPETVREDRALGSILAIGPGRATDYGEFIKVEQLDVGNRVIFNKYTAYELNEEERLYLIRSSDIGCIVND